MKGPISAIRLPIPSSLAAASPRSSPSGAPNARRLFLSVRVGCGEVRRLVHQFEFLAAAVAAASTAVRHVLPVARSPAQCEASYALTQDRSFGRRRGGPLRPARANASDH